MKLLRRNTQTIYYKLCEGTVVVLDDDDNETGEKQVVYSEAYSIRANVSDGSGTVAHEQFGLLADYDKTIVITDTSIPFTEDTIFYLDGVIPSDDTKRNYIVRGISKSINGVSIAVKKVV